MTGKEEWFDELLQDPPEHREKELVTRFLEATGEAVNARYERSALRTTAAFDRFKKEAYQEHDNPLYTKFFILLADLIKEFHLDNWDNNKHKTTDDPADDTVDADD